MKENLNTQMNDNKKIRLTKGDLISIWLRQNLFQGSWNYERMQALGFLYVINPAIKRLYPKGSKERQDALKRHLEFFNTHPYVANPIFGVTAAMEEQRANGQEIPDQTINSLKVGMMGPLAGVGDPIFWGTLRPVLAALGAGISIQSGSLMGPLIFFFSWNIIRLAFAWVCIKYGYERGVDLVSDMQGNLLNKLTTGASIVGLFIMGALIKNWTTINFVKVAYVIPKTAESAEKIVTYQNILDDLLPGIAALGLTFIVMKLLEKKVNVLTIIFGIFVIGIVLNALGILG